RLLRVLSARAARPGRAEADLGPRDGDAARDLDSVVTRLARDGVNSGDRGGSDRNRPREADTREVRGVQGALLHRGRAGVLRLAAQPGPALRGSVRRQG